MVASRGRRGLHEALVNFELLGLGGGREAFLQGDEDGRGLLALEPVIGLHRRLRPDGVRVQVLLEEVRLRRPQGGAGELQPRSTGSISELRVRLRVVSLFVPCEAPSSRWAHTSCPGVCRTWKEGKISLHPVNEETARWQ